MIKRISSINTRQTDVIHAKQHKIAQSITLPQQFLNTNRSLQSKCYPRTINFCSNLQFNTADFNKTIQFNYFKLPKITTKSGKIIQAQPDKAQVECAKMIYLGNNVPCVAPTGTGKTAIANYAISQNLYKQKRTFYTTPLKALSNDKYREFCRLYGTKNVGLMTGDIKINTNAPILIMTTEIYRNMLLDCYKKGDYKKVENVGSVVFDEVHYLSEEQRGRVWEESIMLTDENIQILPLSATIGNGQEFSDWINQIKKSRKSTLVETDPNDRYVPLVFYNYTAKEGKEFSQLITGMVNTQKLLAKLRINKLTQREKRALDELFISAKKKEDYEPTDKEREDILKELSRLNKGDLTQSYKFAKNIQQYYRLKEAKALEITQLLIDSDTKIINSSSSRATCNKEENPIDFSELIEALNNNDKLPAIIFKFSRKGCQDAAKFMSSKNLNLTTDKEKEQISAIIDEYEQNGIFLGTNFNKKELLNGIASHHAGLLPEYKKLIEDLFSKKLIKVVFATSTLSAGINMPAKSVVITSINKPVSTNILSENEEEVLKKQPLSANEFHQMAGRAGRRGIDNLGNVILYKLSSDEQELAQELILMPADAMKSKYRPTYDFLCAYYQRFDDNTLLDYFQNSTFRIFQAGKNRQTELERLRKEFENYTNVLIQEGFLSKSGNKITVTDKGAMLTLSHGFNQITFINMIYNKNLSNISPEELAGFACSISGSSILEDDKDFEKNILALRESCACDIENFKQLINCAKEYDLEVLNNEIDNNFVGTNSFTNGFKGYVGFRWAYMNNHYNYSSPIDNFKRLCDKYSKNSSDLNADINDGEFYKTLVQGADILKQIITICNYALNNTHIQDRAYYEDLKNTAKESLKLIQKPPIYYEITEEE